MHEETVTVCMHAKLEDLENRVDTMHKVARECLDKIDKLIRIARGESP